MAIWKLDRLGRGLKGLITLISELEDREVQFQSLIESIDISSPSGRLLFHIIGAMAQLERELIQERTRAGLAAARLRGKAGGRKRLMTPGKVESARTLLAGGMPSAEVAANLGVSVPTLYRWLPASART